MYHTENTVERKWALRKAGSAEPKPFNAKKLPLKVLEAEFTKGEMCVDVDYPEALKYLRGEALVLPADTPKGIITITYKGQPLGPAKNIGNRANNLYPKAWRIKSTHLPSAAPEVLQIVK